MLSLLKSTAPALRALMAREDVAIDALICPGHVATILGADAFAFLSEEYGLATVVSGFETGDLLYAVHELLRQKQDNAPCLNNEYIRAVSPAGNAAALAVKLNTIPRQLDGKMVREELKKAGAEL